MSAILIRAAYKAAYRGARAMGKFMKKRRSNPNKGKSKRNANRYNRKQKRKTRQSKRKNKRNNKRKYDSAGSGNPDRAYGSRTHGRPAKKHKIIKKLLHSSVTNTTMAIYNFKSAYRGFGSYVLGNIGGALPTDLQEYPLHLWELTAMFQPSGANTKYPVTFYKLAMTNKEDNAATTTRWYAPITGADPTDIVTSVDHERLPANATSAYTMTKIKLETNEDILTNSSTGPGARGYIAGASVKMILNTPTERGTQFAIDLIQLHEEMVPGADQTALNAQFWQAMIKQYSYSPLSDGLDKNLSKYIKFISSEKFNMDAPESSEDHMISRTKTVKFYYNLNRTLNFNWGINADKQKMEAPDLIFNIAANRFSTHVEPKARVYMMVRAVCEKGLAASQTIHPSYDMVMKLYHKSIKE